MTRYCDQCERFGATAFGEGVCPKLSKILEQQAGVKASAVVQGNADADKCKYFKGGEGKENKIVNNDSFTTTLLEDTFKRRVVYDKDLSAIMRETGASTNTLKKREGKGNE